MIDTAIVCTRFVSMKNITLSADEELIEQGRSLALARKTTLNALFREWLRELVRQREAEERWQVLEARLTYARSGGKFQREEMNER